MSKPLSQRSARLLGAALQIVGIVGMLIALGRIEDTAATVLVIMCSGWLMVGTWWSGPGGRDLGIHHNQVEWRE